MHVFICACLFFFVSLEFALTINKAVKQLQQERMNKQVIKSTPTPTSHQLSTFFDIPNPLFIQSIPTIPYHPSMSTPYNKTI
ncbi:hypothetical protein BKA61DRAFT_102965 [Leptodontidium sp. MPI-SDFR-AT-0119]|nr:hypothetical protein BKA61DRAFT_102965 [Leptodontidium sp. MPI-SDFR-AT-0119]